jgi:hypothetical protein
LILEPFFELGLSVDREFEDHIKQACPTQGAQFPIIKVKLQRQFEFVYEELANKV